MAGDQHRPAVLASIEPSSTAGAASPRLPVWVRQSGDRRTLILTLHVQPNARTTAVAGRHAEALRVRVAAPATGNRANEALIAFVSATLGLPRANVRITHGAGSRRKRVAIDTGGRALEHQLCDWDSESTR